MLDEVLYHMEEEIHLSHVVLLVCISHGGGNTFAYFLYFLKNTT